MKTENKKTNEKLDQVMEQLEAGVKAVYTSEKYAEYLRFMGSFHDYSVNNIILIWSQCPGASLVAGFKAWKDKHGRSVKKGEKAIRILAPCPHKMTITETDPTTGEKVQKEVRWNTYRPVCVFDVSQTEGAPLPSLVDPLTGSMERFQELFTRLQAVSPVPVAFEDIKSRAHGYFSPAENRIAIRAGMSNEQTIKTTVHEIAHAILHAKDAEQADAARHVKEVQAESVAYVVCNALGLDTSEYSFGYVAGWAEGQDAKDLTANLDVIKKTASGIIAALTAEGTEKAPAAAPEKASAPSPKKAPKQSKKAPKKAPKVNKDLEKWNARAGRHYEALEKKKDVRICNAKEGLYFCNYYGYYAMFIPGGEAAEGPYAEAKGLPQYLQRKENHVPVSSEASGTLAGKSAVKMTGADGSEVYVNAKYRRLFPKNANLYASGPVGSVIVTIGAGDEEQTIGCLLPIKCKSSSDFIPAEEAKAA